MAIPKFTIVETHRKFYVETDWFVEEAPNSTIKTVLMVRPSGQLATSSAGVASRERALQSIELCKRRLR